MFLRQQLMLCMLVAALGNPGCAEKVDGPSTEPTADVLTSQQDAPPDEPESLQPKIDVEPDDFEPEEGFTRLTVEDFTPFQAEESTWREIDGVIVCRGDPKGYLYSNDTFGNYTWRAEYRFAPIDDEAKRPLSNTGFMIHIREPHKVWPRSLEVQGRWDEMASIKSNGGVPALVINDDPAARESARRPVGEWNAVEIVSQDGGLRATLNGSLICTSAPGELTDGLIGLQSELFEVHFRRMRIRVDEETSAPGIP